MKKKIKGKKLGIILGALGGVIVVCVILCFTLFSLKNVTVDFRTSTEVLTGQEENIVESGNFGYGGCVIFMGKKGAVASIEKANPYVKVINIETVFPSSYIIHCVERKETYAIELNDKVYFVDDEFKVLRIETNNFTSTSENPIIFKGLRVANSNADEGEFLIVENKIDIFSALIENNRLLHEQKALIKEIEIGKEIDENINQEQTFIKLSFHNGQTYIIKNATYGLKYKVAKMIAVYSNIYSILGQAIDDNLPAEGDNVWTAEKIKCCTVEINNFYINNDSLNDIDFPNINDIINDLIGGDSEIKVYTEKDCYFKVLPPQNMSNI